ncbi:MAG: SGNH/GDSL hydrolase family protein [bacterium]|nr:SGNH/GDSL hydrolase family protein [bacterium]
MKHRILLALGSLVASLLGAELLLAIAAPQIYRLPDVWMHDPQLGWKHRPGASGHMVTPEFDVAYDMDAAGRRQHTSSAASQSVQIQLYGDSFAEGWGVEVVDGLAAGLERQMSSPTGVHVSNYGTAGFGTDQELLLFNEVRLRESPDLVLLLFYVNDLWNNVSRRGVGAQRGAKPVFRPDRNGVLQLSGTPIPEPPPRTTSPWQTLRDHSHLWTLGAKAWPTASAMPMEQVQQFYGGLYGQDEARYRPVWSLTELLLVEFARTCERAGAAFVLVYAPAIVQIEEHDWRTKRDLHNLTGDYDMQYPNRQIREIAARHGIALVDLTPSFAAAAREQTLYFRDSHWNEAGHHLAASTVATALARLQIGKLSRRDD